MANGYEPGEYFAQFLSQLPAMYRAKESVDMQKRYITLAEKKYSDALEQQKIANQLAQQKQTYAASKYQKDVFDKERDEEQDEYDKLEKLHPGAGAAWIAKHGKFNIGLIQSSQQHLDIQKDATTMIQESMMAIQRPDVSYEDTLYNLNTIKNTVGASKETIGNVDNAINLINKEYHTKSVNQWISQNPNHPDVRRIALLPKQDAYKEILEKDPARELSSLLSNVSRSTTILQNAAMFPQGLSPASLKLHETLVKSGEQRINKMITPVAIKQNNEVMNQATLQIMQQFPQYFTKDADGKPIPKPVFQKAAQDSVNNLYNRLIKNQ